MKYCIIIFFFFSSLSFCYSQADTSTIKKTMFNGDSIYVVNSEPVFINGKPSNQVDKRANYDRYTRLIFNLKKVYPYAKMTRKKLEDINNGLAKYNTDRERKEFIKSQEKVLFSQYENELKELTVSQGKLLIKLVYRETQRSTFDLIKEYKGPVSAVFWQSIARLFGSNLKVTYDPNGEDQIIEELIILYEKGML